MMPAQPRVPFQSLPHPWVKRAAASPVSRPGGRRRPQTTSRRSCARPRTGVPAPWHQSRSVARNCTPVRSVPKYAMLRRPHPGQYQRDPLRRYPAVEPETDGDVEAVDDVVGERAVGTATRRRPGVGDVVAQRGEQLLGPTSCAASRRAHRSAIRSNRPRDLASSTRSARARSGTAWWCGRRPRAPASRHTGSARPTAPGQGRRAGPPVRRVPPTTAARKVVLFHRVSLLVTAHDRRTLAP